MGGRPKVTHSLPFDLEELPWQFLRLYQIWEANRGTTWNSVRAFAVVTPRAYDVATPRSAEGRRYLKSTTFQAWLLGHKFPATVLVFLPKAVHVICSRGQARLLAPVQEACQSKAGLQTVLHPTRKCEDGASEIDEVLSAVREAAAEGSDGQGKVVMGVLKGEGQDGGPTLPDDGKIRARWAERCSSHESLELVDVSGAMCDLFAVKDRSQLTEIRNAASLAANVLQKFVVPKLKSIIGGEQQVTHGKLMELTGDVVTDPAKIDVDLQAEHCDLCYPPLFQSGGKFDLKPGAVSNDEAVCCAPRGVVVCSIAVRYNSSCASVAWTYLMHPSPLQAKAYEVLLRAQEAAISAVKPGQKMCDVYEAAVAVLQRDAPELKEHLTKDAGAGIGFELGESRLTLSAENETVIAPGTVLNVVLGLHGLKNEVYLDPKTKEYSLLLGDTVVVGQGDTHGASIADGEELVATALAAKVPVDVCFVVRVHATNGNGASQQLHPLFVTLRAFADSVAFHAQGVFSPEPGVDLIPLGCDEAKKKRGFLKKGPGSWCRFTCWCWTERLLGSWTRAPSWVSTTLQSGSPYLRC